jgi:hypothetical protein
LAALLFSLGAPPGDLVGFDIVGPIGTSQLINVRMFWVETLPLSDGGRYMTSAAPISDSLTSTDLPATLPGFGGRLALDFRPVGQPRFAAIG